MVRAKMWGSSTRKPSDSKDREETLYTASQWQLVWRRFKRHKLAMAGGVVIVALYLAAILSDFLSTMPPQERAPYNYAPPNGIHWFDEGHLRPYVYGLMQKIEPGSFTWTWIPDPNVRIPVRFFARGYPYSVLGLVTWDVHLVQADEGGYIFLFGTDKLGRDVFSRVLNGTRISLSVGFVGVVVSFVLGAIIGGFSGFYSGVIDAVIQRIIEFLISMPTIPLWMALSAAVPMNWPPIRVYFAITLILSLRGWTGLARVVRGKLLQVREEDYVMAAALSGSSAWWIITRHMLPAFTSYLIVDLTLAIPGMILGETALSFLGLGLRPPVVSWGVLLKDAQNIRTVSVYTWLLIPALFVVVTVLAFNLMGDGLRDAADPYSK